MCQAKPGPRCSADTGAAWNRAKSDLASAESSLSEAEKQVHSAVTYDINTNTPESRQLREDWESYRDGLLANVNALRNTVEAAKYSYFATPDGLERLNAHIRETEGQFTTRREGFFDDDGEWINVSYKEYKNTTSKFVMEQARSHRIRQKAAYETVNNPQYNKIQKYSASSSLINQGLAELQHLETSLTVNQIEREQAVQRCYVSRNSATDIQQLIANDRSIDLTRIKIHYLQDHIRDLKKYRESLGVTEIMSQK